jgi:DNA-binding MarR family transcriptional regulator
MELDHVDRLLGQWAGECPHLDVSALAVSARVSRLHRFLDLRLTELLDRYALHQGEANVLAALRRSGPPYELTPTALSRSLLISSGAMTNRLDRLEARGLIARIPDREDGRKVQVKLTPEGSELIDAAMVSHTADLEQLLGFVDAEAREQLGDLLRHILLVFERDATR